MSISYYTPEMERENDSLFLSACSVFNSEKYLEAAEGFKKAYESNRDKKWYLMNYATSIRNAGYIDYSLRIYDWLEKIYPRFTPLNEIFRKTVQVTNMLSQNENPCAFLNIRCFEPNPGFPTKKYMINEDFHNTSISLCMIVRNEANNISKAINSVSAIANEIVVVDTGSEDETVQIAESLGANVYHYKWDDNFSKARNYSLKFASKDWILVLDADETISYCDLFYLKEYICNNKEYWGFALIQRDYFNSEIFDGISCRNDYYQESKPYQFFKYQQICRVFRNSEKIYFTYPVYEIVEESIKLNGEEFCYIDIPIHHYGRLIESEKLLTKRKYYIDILKNHLDKNESNQRKSIYCANIARTCSFLGSKQQALEYLNRALDFNPKSDLVCADLGNNALMRNELLEASEWFEKAINLKDRPEYYIKAAQCYIQSDNFLKAKTMIKNCLKKSPDNPIALDLLSKLNYISGI